MDSRNVIGQKKKFLAFGNKGAKLASFKSGFSCSSVDKFDAGLYPFSLPSSNSEH